MQRCLEHLSSSSNNNNSSNNSNNNSNSRTSSESRGSNSQLRSRPLRVWEGAAQGGRRQENCQRWWREFGDFDSAVMLLSPLFLSCLRYH